MPTFAIVLIVVAVLLLVTFAMGVARAAGKGQREYPKQPKGVAHDHDFSKPAPPAQVEQRGIVLDFRHRQR